MSYAETYPGYQDLLRGAAAGLGQIARQGNTEALDILFRVGIPSQDPVRAPVTLALGLVALRNTPLLLKAVAAHPNQPGAIGILAEAFDMLEEDLEEEKFFVDVRRTLLDRARRISHAQAVRTTDHEARFLADG